MILLLLLTVVTSIVDLVFGLIASSFLPWGDVLQNVMDSFISILDQGINMFYFLFGPVALILVTYILSFQVLKHTWDIVWWVIRKIPILNIRE